MFDCAFRGETDQMSGIVDLVRGLQCRCILKMPECGAFVVFRQRSSCSESYHAGRLSLVSRGPISTGTSLAEARKYDALFAPCSDDRSCALTLRESCSMTLTLELSDGHAAALQAKAAAECLSLEEFILNLAGLGQTSQPRVSKPRRHISEIFRENMSRVPPEIMATMPTDGATRHDHYIYGLPKRDV